MGTNTNTSTNIKDFHIQKIADVDMEYVIGEYESPDNIAEWQWIESNASYPCKDNGHSGIWDFVLNVGMFIDNDVEGIPPKLQKLLKSAYENDISYILFNQGC